MCRGAAVLRPRGNHDLPRRLSGDLGYLGGRRRRDPDGLPLWRWGRLRAGLRGHTRGPLRADRHGPTAHAADRPGGSPDVRDRQLVALPAYDLGAVLVPVERSHGIGPMGLQSVATRSGVWR